MVAAARRGRRGKSGLHRATMPDNVRAGRLDGKCHRNDTAGRLYPQISQIAEIKNHARMAAQ